MTTEINGSTEAEQGGVRKTRVVELGDPGFRYQAEEHFAVAGWIKTHRQSKKVAFIELSDGSTIKGLQLVVSPELADYQQVAGSLATGASISAVGTLTQSPGAGQSIEMQVVSLDLVGTADPEEYPLQKKGHTLDFLREHLHLRLRSNTLGAVSRVRSAASFAVHSFFRDRGFYLLHSPVITTSDCEGSGEMFKVTTLPIKSGGLAAKSGSKDEKDLFAEDFFGEPAFLSVSGQLEAEIAATALGAVYTFGPTFRAENSNTTRHLAEFWMIEPEVAFCALEGNIALAADFVSYVIGRVLQECAEDLDFLHNREWCEKGLRQTLEDVVQKRPEVLDYTKAIEVLQKSGREFQFPVTWGVDLQAEHERFLTDEVYKGPVVVINYPKGIKAFYMRANEDGKTVAAMDFLVPRLGEIIGGSQREERYEVLLQRIQECGLPKDNYRWYLDLRKFGTVPHSGFGLGFERLLMYITGMQNIRDVIPFPRFPGSAKC